MLVKGGLKQLLPVKGEILKCSETHVYKCRLVSPTYEAPQLRHVKQYAICELRRMGTLSLKEKN